MSPPLTTLIGKPWRSGARGPESFDCWGLVAWVYEHHLGRLLAPYADLDPHDIVAVHGTIRRELPRWQEVPRSALQDLDVVGMSRNRAIHHVGVWLARHAVVLHAVEGGCVVGQPLQSLRSTFRTINFYRPVP